MSISDLDDPVREIIPGERIDVPVRRCFGQLELSFRSTGGEFYDPRVTGFGSFSGTDFDANPAEYEVEVNAAGTPSSDSAATEGLVVACLPEGSYDFTPFVTSINPGGGTSNTELPPVLGIEIGCGQVIRVTPPLAVNVEKPSCSTEPELTLSGRAASTTATPVTVGEIFAIVDGGPEIPVCTGCGDDPPFTVDVPLTDCASQVTVSAVSLAGTMSSTTTPVRFDDSKPLLAGCDDIAIETDPGQSGTLVDFAVAGADNCDGTRPVTCFPPSGSFFAQGSHEVTCEAIDTCGNRALCQFTVTVDEAPRPLACINGRAVVAQDESTHLSVVGIDGAEAFDLSSMGEAPGNEFNNLGFRRSDGLLYAIELDGDGNIQLVRIDASGNVTELGRPPGLPEGERFDAGDVSPDGRWLFAYASDQAAFTIDLEQWEASPLTISGDSGNVRDWAYHPDDGRLYGCDSTGGQLAILDPSGLRTDIPVDTPSDHGLPTGDAYGAAWFDDGHLYCYRNQSGQLYEIDPSGPSLVGVSSGPGAKRNDGAACSQSILGAAVRMSSSGTEVPQTVVLDYVFENLSLTDSASELSSFTDLRTVFGEHGTDWTFSTISSIPSSSAIA